MKRDPKKCPRMEEAEQLLRRMKQLLMRLKMDRAMEDFVARLQNYEDKYEADLD